MLGRLVGVALALVGTGALVICAYLTLLDPANILAQVGAAIGALVAVAGVCVAKEG